MLVPPELSGRPLEPPKSRQKKPGAPRIWQKPDQNLAEMDMFNKHQFLPNSGWVSAKLLAGGVDAQEPQNAPSWPQVSPDLVSSWFHDGFKFAPSWLPRRPQTRGHIGVFRRGFCDLGFGPQTPPAPERPLQRRSSPRGPFSPKFGLKFQGRQSRR